MPFLFPKSFTAPALPEPTKITDPAIAAAAKKQALALKGRKGRAALNITGGVSGQAPLSQPELGGDTLGA